VTLLFPNSPTGTSVETRRPRLVWTSVRLPPAFGPWRYDVAVTRADGGLAVLAQGLSDTTFAPDVDLEANTPYRWAVTASLAGGDTARAQSRATFVVVDPNAPLVTLLYQNFPNPFPSGASMTTCFWFDLRAAGVVSLRITDLRGFPVRTLVPSATVTAYLPAGRYGRGAATTESGCDTRFAWDGTAADGRTVPAGVYLAWLVANGERSMRKVVFRGR
jgi:hypothetical protein